MAGDVRARTRGVVREGLREGVIFGLLLSAAALGAAEPFSRPVIGLPTPTVLMAVIAFVAFRRGAGAGLAGSGAASSTASPCSRSVVTATGNVYFGRKLGFVDTPKTRQAGQQFGLVRVQLVTPWPCSPRRRSMRSPACASA